MKYEKSKIKEINDIQLEIFRSVKDICDKNSLKYFLVHGTLLGTIKFSGFMPFDDDIDIAMPRSDYEVFSRIANNLLPDYLFFQSFNTEKRYPNAFGKVRDSRTTYFSESLRKSKINQGIYIDVFPIDFVPEIERINPFAFVINKLALARISCSLKNKNRTLEYRMRQAFSFLIFPSLRWANSWREKSYSKCKKSLFISITGGKPTERRIPIDWFGIGLERQFCGINCTIPEKYEVYLNHIYYGDYKHTNLLEKRLSDDEYVEMNADIIDTETSYMDYLKG